MSEAVLEIIFKATDSGVKRGISELSGGFSGLGTAVTAGAKIAVAGLVGITAATVGVGAALLNLGSDAAEMESKFNIVFANTSDTVTAALDEFADAAGRSRYELMGMASTFGDTLKPMGFTEEAAADMSVQLSQLAVDLGSFNNMETDEALRRLQGTLIGSHENALAFGVIINENTLAAEMAANGWDKLTGAELEQAKVQARLNLLMAGTTDAQGDAIRTADGWANSTRALTAKVKDFATEMGLKLLPVMTPLLQKISGLAESLMPKLAAVFDTLTPKLTTIATAFGNFITHIQFGRDPLDGLANMLVMLVGLFVDNENQYDSISEKIFQFKEMLLTAVATVQEFITPIAAWIQENIKLKDVLIALGIVLGGVILSALASLVAAVAPVIAAGAALIGVVALVRTAWEENWGGIQEKVAAVVGWFQENIIPWFQEKIPLAIQFLSDVWTNTLQPALQRVWEWMSTVLIPFLGDVLHWYFNTYLPEAIQFLSDVWTNILQPALERIWQFLTVDMMPIWEALHEFLGVAIPVVLTALKGIWENVLLPAMQRVVDFVRYDLGPIFQWLKDHIVQPVADSFGSLQDRIRQVADWIGTLTESLRNIDLPDWMTPGSPTPWEMGLRGVRDQLRALSNTDIPAFSAALTGAQAAAVNNRIVNQTTNIYTSYADTRGETAAALRFAVGGV